MKITVEEHIGMSQTGFGLQSGTVFVVAGLGSCIGVVVYDPERPLAAIAHVLLPDSMQARESDQPGKFADTAVPFLVEGLLARGARRKNLVAKIAGGSQMFKGLAQAMNIGTRNAEAVKTALEREQIPLIAEDTGGNTGRTIRFEVGPQRFWVRQRGGTETSLD